MDYIKLAQKYNDRVVELRRDIHMHPELSLEEFRTAELVAKELRALGMEVKTGVGKTGVVGLLRGAKEGRTIALRADMDALPIQEENDLPFKSVYPGKMHACGHDVHTAVLLGAAMALTEIKDQLNGTVKFIFQPAEENAPNGGAKQMITEGVLEDPKVDAIVGLHILPFVKSGVISLKKGELLASADQFEIRITGRGCHAASPHLGVDAVTVGAHLVTTLQSVVSRMTDPMEPAVLNVGVLEAGGRENVLAQSAVLKGTCRVFNPKTRENLKARMQQVMEGVCAAFGATGEFLYTYGYPPLLSDPELTQFCSDAATELFGPDGVVVKPKPAMGGEDFAYYTEVIPGAFISLGTGRAEGPNAPMHSPHLMVEEGSFVNGVSFMTKVAVDYLNRP
ncbi:M20 family metallopeptidase [Anaerotruncus rubiinfantis]|uniref:M20 family metallopeptidase n=3 Tax=Anaerotruncus rubiinfantis TaxID=1720200 RepID=UPI0034A59545